MSHLPPLPEWRPTRDALHAWCRFLGAVRTEALPEHPRWWHASLKPVSSGLTTGELGAGAKTFRLSLDLRVHQLVLDHHAESESLVSLRDQPTVDELGDAVLARLQQLGLDEVLDKGPENQNWRSSTARTYSDKHAEAYLEALTRVADSFAKLRALVGGERSPVQFWPHHFDLSLERFFERTIESREGEEATTSQAQIGFGFSTGDESFENAYLYANPWPFAAELTEQALPQPARWVIEPWSGSRLAWSSVEEHGDEVLRAYLDAVWQAAVASLGP